MILAYVETEFTEQISGLSTAELIVSPPNTLSSMWKNNTFSSQDVTHNANLFIRPGKPAVS